ncbi:MAG TPA: ABC transporter ATP-binding protein [Planctomycetaceae bacterium]|jgi:ABC-2 type transport system ATP-binding protein|nr:ABC transporter ATP-binding protein [Planctomycetaceae bacterium]
MPSVIRCQDLVKTYEGRPPVEAVRGLDLEVVEGECFGLLGPNGAGKTTTIEIMEGLLAPTSGTVEVLGRQWGREDDAIRQRIGISFQETKLSEKLSVRETLDLFRSFYKQSSDPAQVMEQVELTEKAKTWVGKLSGGQKQRLAVACALVGDPELLFLDEPTTGLDPKSRRQLWEIIRNYRQRGRTVLLTTHYLDEAERLCDQVAIVDRGKVIAKGTPRELIVSLGGEHVIEFTLGDGSNGAGDGLAGDLDLFSRLPTVQSVHMDHGRICLSVGEPHRTLPALLNTLESQHWPLSSLSTRHASLEDVFVKLAGRHLDDDEAPTA